MKKFLWIPLLITMAVTSCSSGIEQESAAQPSTLSTATPVPPFFPIIESGVELCYNFVGQISCPSPQDILFGQDGNYTGLPFDFKVQDDGTVIDANTGLIWQQAQNNTRATLQEARHACSDLVLAGKDDWRLPTIQELFSIADMSGSTGTRFFLDIATFDIRYAQPDEQFPDGQKYDESGQTWSSSPGINGQGAYIFNFFNGELRTYSEDEAFFFRCVRGNTYGMNDFIDNGDGTILDNASELMWEQAESIFTLNWGAALSYCENLDLAGFDDWRLPNIKELSSLVLNPGMTSLFTTSEAGSRLWSSTSSSENPTLAYYACIANCIDLQSHDLGNGSLYKEPKFGDPAEYEGSEVAVIINNLARCVRGGDVRQVNDSTTVEQDITTHLVVDMEAAAGVLGIDAGVLQSALGTSTPGDPVIQKAAFSLGIDLDALRSALQTHMVEATPAPST